MLTASVLLALAQATLVHIDMVLGTGPEAKSGDVATVSYRGSTQDGKVFDESKGRGPFAFRLGEGQVIKGWDQGLVGMKVGGKRILQIPPNLAYGDEGIAGSIPPKATLIFEIELLRVDAKGRKPMIEVTEIAPGEGPAAKAGDTVEVHYKGTFLDGKQFDSSYDRNQTFPVVIGETKLIPGFTQGLIGMKQGGKRKVVIPYELAYGEQGRPPVIPPMATLQFELEIVKLTPKG